jgi:hypothetical protein
MLLPLLHLADLEYRERIRDFNLRAARGEFIRYADDAHAGAPGWVERFGKLGRAARERFSRTRSLVARPEADSV